MTRRRKMLLTICFLMWFNFITTVGITKVSGESMNNTLQDGKYYLDTNKNVTQIQRFDIVIIDSEELDEYIIKRVVGLPKEKVEIKGNDLYINDEKIEQNFDYIKTTDQEEIEYTLKNNEYFVLGDNRPISLDSRYIGPIKEDEIKNVLINKKL